MTLLRTIILGLGLLLGASSAQAQNCSGQAVAGAICGNPNASTGLPSWATQTALLDRAFGTTSGTVLNRGASVWTETAAPVLGANGGTGGSIVLNGSTSGSVTVGAKAAAGTATIFNLPITNGTLNQVLVTDGAGNTSWTTAGSGTVSSVGLSMPGIFTVTNSPVVGTGTLTATLNTESANTVWAGPTTGAATAPTFRALVGADLPNPSSSTLGGVQSFAAVSSQWIRQISTSGVPTASQPAFTDISGVATGAQLPNPSASTLGGVESLAAVASKWINTISTSGVPSATQPIFGDIGGQATLAQLPSIGNNNLLSNISGGTAAPLGNSLTEIIDSAIGSTQGQVLYRSGTVWTALSPGTSGQVLTTAGAAANPSWTTVTGTGTVTNVATGSGLTGGPITTTGTIALANISTGNVLGNVTGGSAAPSATTPTQVLDVIGSTQGQVLYRGAGVWTALSPGTSGQFLQTQGAGSTPQWVSLFSGNNTWSGTNTWTNTLTQTLNSSTAFTLQDASSSQDTLTFGVNSSAVCDPGYIGTPGSGQCNMFKFTPFTTDTWGGITLQAVNSRVLMSAIGGVGNPEMICADTNTFGFPVWLGGNQSGCGYLTASRTGSNQPGVFNFMNGGQIHSAITASLATGISGNGKLTVTAQSNTPITLGETFVGSGFSHFVITGTSTVGSGNCSPACTGSGGTGTYATSLSATVGSEAMVGGPSGAEASAAIQIWGGSLVGDTQNIIMFLNGSGQANWTEGANLPTLAGMRLGEIAGTGTSGDGLFTQTETWSINGYAALQFSGTHLDGSYTAPTNIVFRQAPNTQNPERITAVFDYNANLFMGTAWTATTASNCIGCVFTGTAQPTNPGLLNALYAPASQQGLTIQNVGGDTGGGHAVLFSNTAGTTVGSITVAAAATAFNTSSDRRLKKDIAPADDVGALIDRLQVVNFTWKETGKRTVGFIAQDEYKVFPDAVTPGDNTAAQPGDNGFNPWQRDDSKLVPILVKEIQQLRRRMTQLEHQNPPGSHSPESGQ